MLQKTFEIATREEAVRVAEYLRSISETVPGSALLQVFTFGFDYEQAAELIQPIRDVLPDICITGMSMFMAQPPRGAADGMSFSQEPRLRLGFFFFEHANVRMLCGDFDEHTPEEMVDAARREIADMENVKGVCVTLAGFSLHVSPLLERLTAGFENIPFFGTMAEVSYTAERHTDPFVFDGERSYLHGVVLLIYAGEDLYVNAEYIFGWKPIGKAMPVLISENDFPAGDTLIAAIDGAAPEKIYHKYLGIGFDDYLTINCCEFPLVVERDGLLLGRTPFACNDDGELIFMGSIRPDEMVRFSYAVREDLIANTEKCSHEMLDFAPQAVELFACGNRSVMLQQDASLELDCFRRFAPDMLHCNAAGEIYYHHGRGAFLNSALVAVGLREGAPQEMAMGKSSCALVRPHNEGAIPLSERILKFLQAMSGDLMRYAQAAQRASEAKSSFLANMSHEIRTPINAILGMDEMILRESGERATLSYAGDIQAAGRTLLSLINDILDLSKVEEGKMEIIPVQYELGSLINDLVNMTRQRAESKGLRFKVHVDEHIPHLLVGDEIRIRQCVLNLLSNAVKYTEKGTVTLEVGYSRLNDKCILLSFRVSDTGIGMKQQDMDKLFAPFSRIEEERNRAIEGTGLGMSITKQLLALMGTWLEVKSEYGKGSTFAFSVNQPVVAWDELGAFAERVGGTQRNGYRERFHAPDAHILIVDDTVVNLTVMRGLLKKTKIRIDTAETGPDALVMAARRPYDLFFIDHMMPGMDGLETLREFRKLPGAEKTPCVALTANAVSGAREMYMEAGFSDYLSKPVDGGRLEDLLMRWLPPEKVLKVSDGKEAYDEERPTVLVVDDDETSCRMAAEILGKRFNVDICRSGIEAPLRAESLCPALILLDVDLGGQSGFAVLDALRLRPGTRDIPVVFLTDESDENTEIAGLRAGAADFVRKPFVPEILLRRSERIVMLDRLQGSLQREVGRQSLRAERLTKEMMLALSKAVDAKDHYTNGHSRRVAAYAAEIARRMGKSEREQEQIYEIGLLHDVGKIGVSEEVINKTSQLTEEEFDQIKRHTVIGDKILCEIDEMPQLCAGARSHHEKYDGTGYPDGLKGDEIPETARILCLADCYDAMTSTRTYSRPRTQADVRAEIERCAGEQFDPDIVPILLRMIDEDAEYRMNEKKADIGIWKNSRKLWAFSGHTVGGPAAEPAEDEADETAELPEQLREIGELDIESGLRHCGSPETYLETLKIYGRTAAASADEIESFWRAGETENVTVKVHALKSTSRAIGAEAIGALAEKLELAGKTGHIQVIQEEIGGLLERFRALGKALCELHAPEEKQGLPLIEPENLREAYDTLREVLSSMDYDSVDFVLDVLGKYRVPESERERCEKLRHAAENFDWDEMAALLQ